MEKVIQEGSKSENTDIKIISKIKLTENEKEQNEG